MRILALLALSLSLLACVTDEADAPADAALDALGDAPEGMTADGAADAVLPDDAALPEGAEADRFYSLSLAYCGHVTACQAPLALDIERCAYLNTERICSGRDCTGAATRVEETAVCLDVLAAWTDGVVEDRDRTTCGSVPDECRGMF